MGNYWHSVKSVHIRSYSVRMQENVDQNNSDYGHFLRSVNSIIIYQFKDFLSDKIMLISYCLINCLQYLIVIVDYGLSMIIKLLKDNHSVCISCYKLDKVSKNEPSKTCGSQALKNWFGWFLNNSSQLRKDVYKAFDTYTSLNLGVFLWICQKRSIKVWHEGQVYQQNSMWVCGKYTRFISKQSPMGILKQATLKNFLKITGKDLYQTLWPAVCNFIKKETPARVISFEFS